MINYKLWKNLLFIRRKHIIKEFILDGNNFNDIDGFYNEIDRLLTKDLTWKTGHNLDAFNDLLRGGFSVFDETVKSVCEKMNKLNIKNLVLYHTEETHKENRKELYINEGKQYFLNNIVVPVINRIANNIVSALDNND